MTTEERLNDLEQRMAVVEARIAPEARRQSMLKAFPGEAPRGEQEPLLPHTMFEVPNVPIRQALYLEFIRFEDGSEGWYAGRPRVDDIAEIRPFTPAERAVADKCGLPLDADAYGVGEYKPRPAGAVTLRKVRNPFVPIPKNCKLADNGWELVEAV